MPFFGKSFAAALALLGVLVLVAACSSDEKDDGASCEGSEECASGRCANGRCVGSDCSCDVAAACGRSSCQEGWLCTRGAATTDQVLAQCRMECDDTRGSCPSEEHCEKGVCREGAEPFSLTWLSFPRAAPCAPRIPCAYEVRASEGVNVETFTWKFGDAPEVETKEPKTSFVHTRGGAVEVFVTARADTGATSDLRTTENVCIGGLGASCDPSDAPCCQGTCGAANVCR